MKKNMLIVFSLIAFYSYGQDLDSVIKAKQLRAIGKPLAPFKSQYQGNVFTNANLKGKTVFINFWFATCTPCLAEFEELNNLYDTLKGNDKFEFISFTFETPDVIKEIAEKYKINYKILSISETNCELLIRKSSYPTSIIVDKNGIIKFFRTGGSVNKTKIRNTIFNDYYPKILSEL